MLIVQLVCCKRRRTNLWLGHVPSLKVISKLHRFLEFQRFSSFTPAKALSYHSSRTTTTKNFNCCLGFGEKYLNNFSTFGCYMYGCTCFKETSAQRFLHAMSIINILGENALVQVQYTSINVHLFSYHAHNLKIIFKLGPGIERRTQRNSLVTP